MIKIAICDDDLITLNKTKEIIGGIAKKIYKFTHIKVVKIY